MATVSQTDSVKEYMIEIISNQPEDSTFDEILRELRLARRIQKGLESARAGRVIAHEEMEKRIESWPD